MSDGLFPSGQWVGYYNYPGLSRRYMMDLILEFADGRITGEGHDGIGAFVILGNYSTETRECSWDKTYVARHTVKYKGFRENKGIWGTWLISAFSNGGFHIWPLSEGAALAATEAEDSSQQPVVDPRILTVR
jgi:hypothetical protein